MLVVLMHLGGAFAAQKYFNDPIFIRLIDIGLTRMEFFFVLSGFVITYVHYRDLGQPQKALSFLSKRAMRVFPPYWIILAAAVLGLAIMPALRGDLPQSLGAWLQCLFLIPQDPAIAGGTGAPVLIVAWTLHYEIVFYALFALCILNVRWGVAAAAAAVGWWLAAELSPAFPRFPLDFLKPYYFISVGFGVVIGLVTRRLRLPRPWAWTVAGIALYLGVAVARDLHLLDQHVIARAVGYAFASALIVVGLVHAEQGQPRRAPKLMVSIGDASYALYLLHFPIVSVLIKLAMLGPRGLVWQTLDFVLIFAACCAAALAFHRWIEMPIVNAVKPRRAAIAAQPAV
jgi:peptidoglycan/LPS O-acetylase OafA/YrhL